MMQVLTALEFAKVATKATGATAVVIEAINGGGDQRFRSCFPSLENGIELCEGPATLPTSSKDEGLAIFRKLVGEYDRDDSLMETLITLVSAGETVEQFDSKL